MKDRISITHLAVLGLAVTALSACEMRHDGDAGEEPAPVETQEATPAPTSSESVSPSASIIREDFAPDEEVALPTEPVELTIPFPDGSDVSARAERLLAGILSSDAMGEEWPVILSGHTDSSGNDQANMRASRSRAEAVAAWLVERGVDDDRIQVIAFGEQNPIAPNALPDGSPNEQGRRTNRRVELRIAPPRARAAAAEPAAKERTSTN